VKDNNVAYKISKGILYKIILCPEVDLLLVSITETLLKERWKDKWWEDEEEEVSSY
jgi:hypothetical protein